MFIQEIDWERVCQDADKHDSRFCLRMNSLNSHESLVKIQISPEWLFIQLLIIFQVVWSKQIFINVNHIKSQVKIKENKGQILKDGIEDQEA